MRTVKIDFLKIIRRTIIVTILFLFIPHAYAQDEENEYRLKEIVVIGNKSPSSVQETATSISAFDREMLEETGINLIGELAGYVPNINMVEFSERILSQPYFRGIGSGPNNPAVTTYIDGVPQLHGYSANIAIIDVDQAEFMRGAQGMLYGRNTVGGVIHILSRHPNNSSWEYSMEGEYGSYDLIQGQFRISGPIIKDELGISLAAGYVSRDGFTDNDITGNDIDSRRAFMSRIQLEWLPNDQWSARFLLTSEQDRDGDYALSDLAGLRANPYHGQRDYEGYLDRDILAPTLVMEYAGHIVDFKSITGLVKWETDGATDLDYTPNPSMVRDSDIRDLQISQEFQWRSAEEVPIVINEDMKLMWQTGALFFMQEYRETSVNSIAQPFPIEVTSPSARLDDTGIGVYGQAILTARDVWDVALGLRMDYENKDADLQTYYIPPIAPSTALNTDRDFTEISPHFSLTRRLAPGKLIYGSVSRGYRAGGFNPISPEGNEAYEEETSINYETGVKTTWLEERLKVNIAAFYIFWDHLQLNLPFMQNYFIANAGDAESAGVELEVSARPLRNWEIFGSFGYNQTQFGDGTTSIRTNAFGENTTVDISRNDLIFTPKFTLNAGTQYSWQLGPYSRIFLRAEIKGIGRYYYNTANTESQKAYWITDIRAGYKANRFFAEVWGKNIFDTDYIPVAFEFPNYQSGFAGENGAPRMFGLRTGLYF